MREKWLTLPCPTCRFPHKFKRQAWREEPYLASYITDDSEARQKCKQELFFGIGTYEEFVIVAAALPKNFCKLTPVNPEWVESQILGGL